MVNWGLTWIAIFISVAISLNNAQEQSKEFAEVMSALKANTRGIVMLDTFGRPKSIKRTPMVITDPSFKRVIEKNIESYFIWDWNTLTDTYNNKIETVKDLEKYNPKFKEFKENYIAKKDKVAAKQFLSFEKYLVYLIQNDNLPESISVTRIETKGYQAKGDSFEGKILIGLSSTIFNTDSGKYIQKKRNIVFEVEGFFNPSAGNTINPLGLFYTNLKTAILTKN